MASTQIFFLKSQDVVFLMTLIESADYQSLEYLYLKSEVYSFFFLEFFQLLSLFFLSLLINRWELDWYQFQQPYYKNHLDPFGTLRGIDRHETDLLPRYVDGHSIDESLFLNSDNDHPYLILILKIYAGLQTILFTSTVTVSNNPLIDTLGFRIITL